ncbi:SGNH/GDSL hydrolase family protein [Georgenia sp. Z1491]|uniref:SGNH/GDSL hydrolase family protein n=1 Tax=Georgenia sp. Z1491 TaxID=3416707 RepID=UPI003CE9B419
MPSEFSPSARGPWGPLTVTVGAVAAGAVAACGAAAAYLQQRGIVSRQVPVHREYWARRTHEVRASAVPHAFHLVVVGDSAAQGVGVPDPEHGWVARVERRLAELLGRPVVTTNLSVSGATTSDLIDDQLPLLEGLEREPDLVICEIGANDVARRQVALPGFTERVGAIADALPHGSVVADVPSYGYGPHEMWVRRANTAIRETAEAHDLHVAPLHAATRPLWPRIVFTHMAQDLFHPNAAGYEVWADALWEGVAEALHDRGLVGADRLRHDAEERARALSA